MNQLFYPDSDVLMTFDNREEMEKWCSNHPGTTIFNCEFCGIYRSSEARCNMCEKDE